MSTPEQFYIGNLVHALLADGRCGVAWITGWDMARGVGSLAGFREPLGTSFTDTMLTGTDVAHDETAIVPPAPEGATERKLVVSFHIPGGCRWAR
jgi:hypothetical protein